jgi:hypothetical protein
VITSRRQKQLVLLIFGILLFTASCKEQKAKHLDMFPVLPPVEQADPNIRHTIDVEVPFSLAAEYNPGYILLWPQKFESVSLSVGKNMIFGTNVKRYHVLDSTTKILLSELLTSSIDFKNVQYRMNQTDLDGKERLIETQITIFETDIPAQHLWSPYSNKYKVLWQKTFRNNVTPLRLSGGQDDEIE